MSGAAESRVRNAGSRWLSFVLFTLASFSGAANAVDVTVTDAPYSAKGDNTTNDRVAIQNAIDYVASQGGGKVTIPAGKTFLTGSLTLKSNITLEILGTLQMSNNAADHATFTGKGMDHCGSYNWCAWLFFNYPLIYGPNGTTNVTVQGPGTLRAAWGGSSDNTIEAALIGFFKVNNFAIRNLTGKNACAYHVALFGCNNGRVDSVTVKEPNGQQYYGDGFSIQNCQDIVLDHDSALGNSDDACYIWSAYHDARHGENGQHNSGGWWNTDSPQASRNIEIRNCFFSPRGTKSFAFFPWADENPDKSMNEISNIYVHNCQFGLLNNASWAFCIQCNDQIGSAGCVPMSNITFANNTYQNGLQKEFQNSPKITDCVLDFTSWSGTLNRPSTFQNAGFETNGTPYWSLKKNSNAASAGAKNDAAGQSGSWYGFIDNLADGDARIYQGLYLTANTYTFTAKVQSSGATVQLMALDKNNAVLAARDFHNTSWADQCVTFTTSGADIVRLGIQRGAATGGWARIDDARLATGSSCVPTRAQPAAVALTSAKTPGAGDLIYNMQGRFVGRIVPVSGTNARMGNEQTGVYCAVGASGRFKGARLVCR